MQNGFALKRALPVLVAATMAAHGRAQVTLDGSAGPARTLSGPRYLVNPADGLLRGGNLLHSFDQLNLRSDESISFRGFGPHADQGVHRFIVRVTGAEQSIIDGRIASPVHGASLFLLNPNGIIFGPHAKIDIYGSFVASTADYLRLA